MRVSSKVLRIPVTIVVLIACISVSGQSLGDYTDFSMDRLPGRIFIPEGDLAADKPLPLILALHGGGGIGSDNFRHLVDFNPLLVDAKTRGAYVYAPQAMTAFWHLDDRPTKIMEMIDRVIADRNADPARIYVTGFSMGGGGTWDMLKLFPERFAAGIPIAAIDPRVTGKTHSLLQTPIWVFHARDDSVVSATKSRVVIDSLLDQISEPSFNYPPLSDRQTDFDGENESPYFRYTEWTSGGHAIWWRAYQSKEVLDWLFAQRLFIPTFSLRAIHLDRHNQILNLEVGSNTKTALILEQSLDLKTWETIQVLEPDSKSIGVGLEEAEGYYRIGPVK